MVIQHERPLQSVPDAELLRRLAELLCQSRRVETDLVAHIGEVDERRLWAREASPSMFAYCTEVLHLSEAEAYLRIAAARASREHPMLLAMLADGLLHLSGIARLAAHLTRENRDAVLAQAAHKSKRQIEELVATLAPRPDAPAVIRKLPGRGSAAGTTAARELVPERVGASSGDLCSGAVATLALGLVPNEAGTRELCPDRVAALAPAPARPATVEPIAPSRYKVQFTASAGLRDKLERLQALMRSSVPDGDLAAVIEDAVTEKLRRLEARRFGRTEKPRQTLRASETAPGMAPDMAPSSRHIPAAVRRAVRERDGDRCRYVDVQGRRCSARDRLEFHHRHPFGHGGGHTVENVCLLCRAHNSYLAEVDYGSGVAPTAWTPTAQAARARSTRAPSAPGTRRSRTCPAAPGTPSTPGAPSLSG